MVLIKMTLHTDHRQGCYRILQKHRSRHHEAATLTSLYLVVLLEPHLAAYEDVVLLFEHSCIASDGFCGLFLQVPGQAYCWTRSQGLAGSGSWHCDVLHPVRPLSLSR